MKDSGSARVVAVKLTRNDDKMRVNGTILIACNMNVPGTKAVVQDAVEQIGRCGHVTVDYPTDWEDTQ